MNVVVWNHESNEGVVTWRDEPVPRTGEAVWLFDELYRVTTVVHLPSQESGGTVTAPASLVLVEPVEHEITGSAARAAIQFLDRAGR